MTLVYCSIPDSKVNPLFEVFDGGDLILSSYRGIEAKLADVQIYFPDRERIADAKNALAAALEIVGVKADILVREVADEDWKYAYRRHFTTERVSPRIIVHPEWEPKPEVNGGEIVITIDPGLAFGTGKHETTKACLQYIDEVAPRGGSFLDMGCGSGILSIAAQKLGFKPVAGFDVDEEAVAAARENARLNGEEIEFFRYGLGAKVRKDLGRADVVAANILGPLLVKFADEITAAAKRDLIISGILAEIYDDVLDAFTKRGFKEVSRKTIGEWTTGLLIRNED